MPANDLRTVRSLLSDENNLEVFQVVLAELGRWGLDTDDLISIICDDLGDGHHFKSKATASYYPATVSDYYSIWVMECCCRIFIKFLIADKVGGGQKVVVTSFKKDNRYV